MKLSLSANISKLRKEHAMTQEQLAEALGVTFASVSKWERKGITIEYIFNMHFYIDLHVFNSKRKFK